MLRTLSLLRSLRSTQQSLAETRATIQRARDYHWLSRAMAGSHFNTAASPLADATPCTALIQLFPATPERLRGGNWPDDAEARERCLVEGQHACRAAGAPAYQTMESLTQGLVHGALSVLNDAARLNYLIDRQALRLTWRRPNHLDATLAPLAGRYLSQGTEGLFILELKVPGRDTQYAPSAKWLDGQVDRYRKLLPPTRQ